MFAFEGILFGQLWSEDSVWKGVSPGIRSEEGRSGEVVSYSYHIIIWYIEGLCPRKLCLSKNREIVSEIIISGRFPPGIMSNVISLLIFFFQFLT